MEAIFEQTTPVVNEQKSLREHMLEAARRYFSSINGRQPLGARTLFLEEAESAIYEAVMRFTKGNQSRAAVLMGVSRGTLRTKLKHYFGTTHVGLDERN